MSEIHSCSYYCTRSACVLAQRDELRDKLMKQQAEPVQEPVGAVLVNRESREGVMFYSVDMIPDPATLKDRFELVKVYTAPPQRKPLTEDEIWGLAANCLNSVAGQLQFARAIERAHGIKEAK